VVYNSKNIKYCVFLFVNYAKMTYRSHMKILSMLLLSGIDLWHTAAVWLTDGRTLHLGPLHFTRH